MLSKQWDHDNIRSLHFRTSRCRCRLWVVSGKRIPDGAHPHDRWTPKSDTVLISIVSLINHTHGYCVLVSINHDYFPRTTKRSNFTKLKKENSNSIWCIKSEPMIYPRRYQACFYNWYDSNVHTIVGDGNLCYINNAALHPGICILFCYLTSFVFMISFGSFTCMYNWAVVT